MEIITNAPSVAELQAQLDEERANSGRLYQRVHELEQQLAGLKSHLHRREGHLQSMVRAGDRYLEAERQENSRLRAKIEELDRPLPPAEELQRLADLRQKLKSAPGVRTTCPACKLDCPNEKDWRDGVCAECFVDGRTVPS